MLQEVCKLIGQVGRVDVPVLITGESGTGKELVAESVWKVSTRWEKPFVVLNCAAIPETLLEAELFGYEKGAFTGASASRIGKFEEADGGIIFLDEIGDMPFSLQAKVLRVLQSGTFHRLGSNKEISVDVRIITATNKDLEKMVREGKFREDLYFRINVVRIHLPALKERKEDIPLLCECFTRRHSTQIGKEIKGSTSKFQKTLMEYDWPGNVRELENVIERAVVLCRNGTLNTDTLPDEVREPQPSEGLGIGIGMTTADAERVLILETLKSVDNSRTKAAEILGISIRTLRNKINEYRAIGIEVP
jgi:transcriptional regulator with PAS, ATPase and Fis domain